MLARPYGNAPVWNEAKKHWHSQRDPYNPKKHAAKIQVGKIQNQSPCQQQRVKNKLAYMPNNHFVNKNLSYREK